VLANTIAFSSIGLFLDRKRTLAIMIEKARVAGNISCEPKAI